MFLVIWYLSRRWRRWSRTRGPRLFSSSPPRSPGGVRDGPLRVGEASQPPREVSRHLCSGHIALGQRPALRPHPLVCSPGCAPSTPFSDPHSPQRLARGPSSRPPRRLGLRATPKSHSRETVSKSRAARADTANQHVRALRLPAPLAAVAAERRLAQRDHQPRLSEGLAHGQA